MAVAAMSQLSLFVLLLLLWVSTGAPNSHGNNKGTHFNYYAEAATAPATAPTSTGANGNAADSPAPALSAMRAQGAPLRLHLVAGQTLEYTFNISAHSDCKPEQHSRAWDSWSLPTWGSPAATAAANGLLHAAKVQHAVPPQVQPHRCRSGMTTECDVAISVLRRWPGDSDTPLYSHTNAGVHQQQAVRPKSGDWAHSEQPRRWLLQLDVQQCTLYHTKHGIATTTQLPREDALRQAQDEEVKAAGAGAGVKHEPTSTSAMLKALYTEPLLFVQVMWCAVLCPASASASAWAWLLTVLVCSIVSPYPPPG